MAAIVATYLVLGWTQRASLKQAIESDIDPLPLSGSGKVAAIGILVAAIVLLAASAFDVQLGLPTLISGVAIALVVLSIERQGPWNIVQSISWGILPLVAGLFVIVEAIHRTGFVEVLGNLLDDQARAGTSWAMASTGAVVAFACNIVNNLPAGLLAGRALSVAHVPPEVKTAILIGVDLGPNLSLTGSLATLLWLNALRREGLNVSAVQFLKIGLVVMPPALFLALGVAWMTA